MLRRLRPEAVMAPRVGRMLSGTGIPRPVFWNVARNAPGVDNVAPNPHPNSVCGRAMSRLLFCLA